MQVCQSKYHGTIRFEHEQVLHVPAGLFGFPDEKEFLLLEMPSTRPLAFVQSIRTPDLCFISLPVQVVMPEYKLELGSEDIESLGYTVKAPPAMGQNVLCLVFLTMREKQTTTANLMAPLVIDIARHRGLQALVQGSYSHQHALTTMEWKRAC